MKKQKLPDFDKEFEEYCLANYPQWFWEALCAYEANEVNALSVNYLESKWGKEKLPELIKSYCDFEKVLGVTENEFESGWRKFVEEKY